jgi:CO dehydrogenase/acetyl-CoA synthase epsilon subunit
MKNDSHARVVRSVIKTAGNKVMVVGANIVNSNNKENNRK